MAGLLCCGLVLFLISALAITPDLATGLNISMTPKADPLWYLEGGTILLNCVVEGAEDVTPEWWKDSEILGPNSVEPHAIVLTLSKDLESPTFKTILTLEKKYATGDDSGSYMCLAGGVDVVKSVALVTVTTRDVNLTLGFQTTLACDVEPFHEKMSITWLKGQTPLARIPELEGRVTLGQFNKTLTIMNSKTSDTGIYSCIIKFNPELEWGQSISQLIGIQGKPHIISNPSSLEQLKNITNTSILLTCPATGYPTPEVFWLRDDDVVEPSDRFVLSSVNGVQNTKLEIKDPMDKDFGTYVCVAENGMGKSQIRIDLKENNSNAAGMIQCGWIQLMGLVIILTLGVL